MGTYPRAVGIRKGERILAIAIKTELLSLFRQGQVLVGRLAGNQERQPRHLGVPSRLHKAGLNFRKKGAKEKEDYTKRGQRPHESFGLPFQEIYHQGTAAEHHGEAPYNGERKDLSYQQVTEKGAPGKGAARLGGIYPGEAVPSLLIGGGKTAAHGKEGTHQEAVGKNYQQCPAGHGQKGDQGACLRSQEVAGIPYEIDLQVRDGGKKSHGNGKAIPGGTMSPRYKGIERGPRGDGKEP